MLVGFYFERTSASNAANKAFITNRVGDAGFIIGLLVIWTYVGTFNFEDIFRKCGPQQERIDARLDNAGQIVRADSTSSGRRRTRHAHHGETAVRSILFPAEIGHDPPR